MNFQRVTAVNKHGVLFNRCCAVACGSGLNEVLHGRPIAEFPRIRLQIKPGPSNVVPDRPSGIIVRNGHENESSLREVSLPGTS
jgi:hypothetical protein